MTRIVTFVLALFVCIFLCSCNNRECNVFQSVSKELAGNYGDAKDVRIAVIDSGIDLSVTEEQYLLNFSDEETAGDTMGHGTIVHNIISNLASAATVYSIKVINRYGNASTNSIVAALEWCLDNSIDIINLSLSFGSYNESIECIINELIQNGVVIVASINNTNTENDFPSMYDGVICVGITNTPERYDESRRIVFRGNNVVKASGKYYSGNSFYAPVVTGIIACVIDNTTKERRRTSEELVKDVIVVLAASNVDIVCCD